MNFVEKLVAAAVSAERAEDAETGNVEVVRNKHHVDAWCQPAQGQARGHRGHALGGHGDVEPLGDPGLRQQRVEILFLDKQDGGASVFWYGRWRQGAGVHCKRRLGHRPLAEVLVHFDRAKWHIAVGVCSMKLPRSSNTTSQVDVASGCCSM
jgi:hypothetical protein